MKSIIIKRIGISSFARYAGVASAILGLVYAVVTMFAGISAVLLHETMSTISKILASVGIVVGSLILIPAIMFALGWLYGAVVALIINLFLNTSKGIELDIEEEKK